MRRVRSGICILLTCFLVFTSYFPSFGQNAANEEDKTTQQEQKKVVKYDLKALSDRLVAENITIKKLNIDKELLKIKYEDNLKEYNDLSIQAEQYEEFFSGLETNIAYADKAIKETTNPTERQQMEIYKQNLLYSYVSIYSQNINLFKQQLNMMQSMEALKLQQKQLPQKIENEIALEKFTLQKDYYTLCMLDQQLQQLKQDLANTRKSLDLERTKVGLNLSTQLNVTALENQERALSLSVQQMENTINMAIDDLKTKVGIPLEEGLNIELKIPTDSVLKDYSLSKLLTQFKEKNLELESIKSQSSVLKTVYERSKLAYDKENNKIRIAELEYQQSLLDEAALEKDLEAYVKQVYYQYLQAKNDLFHKKLSQKLYEDNERILDIKFGQGLISELTYTLQKQEAQKFYVEVKQAVVTYENMKKQIELVEKGIIVK